MKNINMRSPIVKFTGTDMTDLADLYEGQLAYDRTGIYARYGNEFTKYQNPANHIADNTVHIVYLGTVTAGIFNTLYVPGIYRYLRTDHPDYASVDGIIIVTSNINLTGSNRTVYQELHENGEVYTRTGTGLQSYTWDSWMFRSKTDATGMFAFNSGITNYIATMDWDRVFISGSIAASSVNFVSGSTTQIGRVTDYRAVPLYDTVNHASIISGAGNWNLSLFARNTGQIYIRNSGSAQISGNPVYFSGFYFIHPAELPVEVSTTTTEPPTDPPTDGPTTTAPPTGESTTPGP